MFSEQDMTWTVREPIQTDYKLKVCSSTVCYRENFDLLLSETTDG
jgi:hypothetical protein